MAGLDRADLLRAAGLGEMDVADPHGYVEITQQLRLGEAIAAQLPGVNFGLLAARAATTGSLGVLGLVLANTPTFEIAVRELIRYQRLVSDGLEWKVTQVPEGLSVATRSVPALAHLIHPIEASLAMLITLGRTLTGVAWRPVRVGFCHQPVGDPAEHTALFGVPVRFAASASEMVLSPETLALPIHDAHPERHGPLVEHLRSVVAQVDVADGTSGRVRAHLAATLSSGPVTLADVAARLHMSPRTLSRHLRGENTSFQRLLDGVRQDLVRGYLRNPAIAVYEVAFLLGYTEPSTFFRAFKRWSGQTPADYRRQLRDDGSATG